MSSTYNEDRFEGLKEGVDWFLFGAEISAYIIGGIFILLVLRWILSRFLNLKIKEIAEGYFYIMERIQCEFVDAGQIKAEKIQEAKDMGEKIEDWRNFGLDEDERPKILYCSKICNEELSLLVKSLLRLRKFDKFYFHRIVRNSASNHIYDIGRIILEVLLHHKKIESLVDMDAYLSKEECREDVLSALKELSRKKYFGEEVKDVLVVIKFW